MRRRGALALVAAMIPVGAWRIAASDPAPRVLVLENFETPASAGRWQGLSGIVVGRASHGRHSARVALDRPNLEISSAALAADWRGYDRLLFDIYQEHEDVSFATLRIYDAVGGDAGQAQRYEYFEAHRKILLIPGWNHVEVKLPLKAATYARDIALDRIVRVALSFEASRAAASVWVDNLRLVSGRESAATMSRVEPQDHVSIIDNRWVTSRQAARPEDVPEAPEVGRLRNEAAEEAALLERSIRGARVQGLETAYRERHLVVADLGLRVRPLLPWYNNDRRKREMFSYIAETCRRARREIDDQLRGVTPRAEVDDTHPGHSPFEPYPPLKGRQHKGWFFRDENGDPIMVLSLHSPSHALQRFFATPLQHIESYTVGGGSRWTIEESPVYAAFHSDPDTHRVGWDGWCGHLVRDLDSMGGTKKENVVICLESPKIRAAVSEYIKSNIPKLHENRELLYDIMAYELMYMCYCDRSKQMFRQWLEAKHGTIDRANARWTTAFASFEQVGPPPVKNARPLPGTNRALWYDWARFNQDRFTDYLLWVREQVRAIDPRVPLAAGGSSYMLAGLTGVSGIDEERIVNEVDDVIIHEGGGSTLGMDLQLALANEKKPLADPEMSVGEVHYLLPHFLHGKSVAQLYHWPAQPANEFHSNTASSLAHSWQHSLADVDELLRVALDVRRLNREIAAFVDARAEVAILYSQTSTLQLPPEMLSWQATPYLAELRKTYEASQYLDAKVTFITERQIEAGKLGRYKLLLVPGARNVPESVVAAIWRYAAAGGRVLIVPESLLGDEYNAAKPYLSKIGIDIRRTERPRAEAAGTLSRNYDQSFSRDLVFSASASERLSPDGGGEAIETSGVRQVLEHSGPAAPLYRYANGAAAILRVPVGDGAVVYSGASLEPRGYARLIDRLMTEAGVSRPVRVQSVEGNTWQVEARFAKTGSRELLYVVNFSAHPARLRIVPGNGKVAGVRELRGLENTQGDNITVPARQTVIYELH
jgi:beta-galactosidase